MNSFRYCNRIDVISALTLILVLSVVSGWSGFFIAAAIIAVAGRLRYKARDDLYSVHWELLSKIHAGEDDVRGLDRGLRFVRQRTVRLEKAVRVSGVVSEQEFIARDAAANLTMEWEGGSDQARENVLVLWRFPKQLSAEDRESVRSTLIALSGPPLIDELESNAPWVLWMTSCGFLHGAPWRVGDHERAHLNGVSVCWSPSLTRGDVWQWLRMQLDPKPTARSFMSRPIDE